MTPQPHEVRTSVTFMIVYCIVYVATVAGAARLFENSLARGWMHVLPYRGRLAAAVVIAAVVSCILGNLGASIGVSSYAGMGPDVMTPKRFFKSGWLSFLAANAVTVVAAFTWAVTRSAGKLWVQAIGIELFNLVMLVAVPTISYFIGVMAVIIVESIAEAQRR